MLGTLVVGIDFSKYSKLVVKQSQLLATKMKAQCVYVFVFQENPKHTFKGVKSWIEEHNSQKIRTTYGLGKRSKIVVAFGNPSDQLIRIARGYERPWIVVGHAGHSGIGRFFLGSTSEKLAIRSPFPVWVQRGQKVTRFGSLLIPCDFSSTTERLVRTTQQITRSLKLRTECFHVSKDPVPSLDFQAWSLMYSSLKKSEELGLKALKRKFPRVKIVRTKGNVVESIVKRSKAFDVIAISPNKHSKHKKYFGSVTSKLIRNADQPILVFP